MKNEVQLVEMENLFTALADRTRLRLLNLMREGEICVCFFTEALGESQPKISRHLAYLRKAGLVETRRDGKWMHYQISFPKDEHAKEILLDTLNWLRTNDEMRAEYENFVKVCCSIDVPVTISKAPKPEAVVEANLPSNQRHEIETHLL